MPPWPVEAISVRSWERDSSRATVSALNDHVIGIELKGSVAAEALDVIEPVLLTFLERSGAARMFWDAEEMSSYDAAVRDTVAKLFRNQRSQWMSVDVLFNSVFIGLAVTGVGLAFGGAIKGHRSRAAFDLQLERALAETRGRIGR